MTKKPKKKKHIPNPNGRPIEKVIEPIHDNPNNVAKAVMRKAAKKGD